MVIPILNREPRNIPIPCPVCKGVQMFHINPNKDGTACCLGCAVVIVIPVMIEILKRNQTPVPHKESSEAAPSAGD